MSQDSPVRYREQRVYAATESIGRLLPETGWTWGGGIGLESGTGSAGWRAIGALKKDIGGGLRTLVVVNAKGFNSSGEG